MTDSSYLSSLTRTSTAEKFGQETQGRNTVDGAVGSGLESGVCLTHTKSSMTNRSKTSMSRKLPRKPSESGESLSSAGGGFRRKLTFSSSRDHTDRSFVRTHSHIHTVTHDYFTLLYLLYSTLLYSTLLYSTPLHSTPLHSTPLHSTPLRSAPIRSALPCPALPCPALPCPALLRFASLRFTSLHFTSLHFTLLYFT